MVVRLLAVCTGCLYSQDILLVLISVAALVTPGGHEAGGRFKSVPTAPSGFDPATFWRVAQCLNEMRYSVAPIWASRALPDNPTVGQCSILLYEP